MATEESQDLFEEDANLRPSTPWRTVITHLLRLPYGLAFGYSVWYLLVQPYARYINFGHILWLPVIFSAAIACVFVVSLRCRATMVLFIPNLAGNATQNYIIVMFFIFLFTNPVANIAHNSVESVRVIGCAMTMTFEHLKERGKLIMSPFLELIKDPEDAELKPIKQTLSQITDLVSGMRDEAEFFRNKPDRLPMLIPTPAPTVNAIAEDIKTRADLGKKETKEVAKRVKDLIQDARIGLDDSGNLNLKASLDVDQVKDMMRLKPDEPSSRFNLTQIMFENCLLIFQKAKASCVDAVEDMRLSCVDRIGSFLAAIWCSPISFTMRSTCPFIMNQLVDENNMCQKMRQATSQIRIDPYKITANSDINDVYKNLTHQLNQLGSSDSVVPINSGPRRFELSISFNNQTRGVFNSAKTMYDFIRGKYRIRRKIFHFLLLLYDIYTTYTFLCIMVQANKYRLNYLTDIKYDNHYITGLFAAIDRRRRSLGRPTVLPLTKDEQDKFMTPFSCKRRTDEERQVQRCSCVMVVLFLLFTLTLIYFDYLFYAILDSIHQHAQISYAQLGHHELDIKVKGEGTAARLIRRLTSKLNSVYDLNRKVSNSRCLPNARQTGNRFYVRYLWLIVAYLFIDQISIYAMRLRRATAAFFYPDKERQRIIYLYNLILVRRRAMKRAELDNYLSGAVDDSDDEGDLFTARDALVYLRNCISSSLSCRCDFARGATKASGPKFA